MYLNQWKAGIGASLALAMNVVFALSPPVYEQLQVPQCLAAHMALPHEVLAENKHFKIIEVLSQDLGKLALLADQTQCGRFVNVSQQFSSTLFSSKQQSAQALLRKNPLKSLGPQGQEALYAITHQEEVHTAFKELIAENLWQTVTHLTSFHNRSATKDTGVETALWLKSQFEAMATAYDRSDTAAYFVKTGWYKQPSLVTVIGKDLKAPAIILGAHMDTLDGRMPGAGDDASGSASIMEAARVLLASKITLNRPVYIIWYAAEERGLVGSQYVVRHFIKQAIPVKAVAQFDMTGYRANAKDPTMWVYTDFTDLNLSNYLAQLIDTYIQVPVAYSSCGYGCSDHASWTEEGIPAAFPCESNFEDHNPFIHTASDTMDLLTLEHMVNFSKLALAFAIELGLE